MAFHITALIISTYSHTSVSTVRTSPLNGLSCCLHCSAHSHVKKLSMHAAYTSLKDYTQTPRLSASNSWRLRLHWIDVRTALRFRTAAYGLSLSIARVLVNGFNFFTLRFCFLQHTSISYLKYVTIHTPSVQAAYSIWSVINKIMVFHNPMLYKISFIMTTSFNDSTKLYIWKQGKLNNSFLTSSYNQQSMHVLWLSTKQPTIA